MNDARNTFLVFLGKCRYKLIQCIFKRFLTHISDEIIFGTKKCIRGYGKSYVVDDLLEHI